MFVTRLGNLNALEQLQSKSSALHAFVEASLPSADTIGRVRGTLPAGTISHLGSREERGLASMLQKIRRVVTGHNAEGKSVIVSDEASPNTLAVLDDPAYGLTDLWVTSTTPADNSHAGDPANRKIVLEPPSRGSIFRVVEFPPDMQMVGKLDREAAFKKMSASATMDPTARHPGMHKTSTLDYAIVLSGEIYAMMDIGETKLSAGDCLIQRGTNHAWSNRSDKPCLIAFILLDAEPLGTDSSLGESAGRRN